MTKHHRTLPAKTLTFVGVFLWWYHTPMYWLRERVHPMWQVTAGCLGILVGVGIAQWANDFYSYWWLAGAITIMVACFWVARRWLLLAMFIAGGLIGLWRGGGGGGETVLYREGFGAAARVGGRVV